MINKAEKYHKLFPNQLDIIKIRQSVCIGDIENNYLAKIFNYSDKYDYWKQNGCQNYLSKIIIPCFIMNSLDDPFFDIQSIPTYDDIQNAPIRLIYHLKGGHCGFMAENASFENNEIKSYGWVSDEIGRGILHIHENLNK